MNVFARFWKWLTTYDGIVTKKTTVQEKIDVYFNVNIETGDILNIVLEQPVTVKDNENYIRIYDFVKDSDSLSYTKINWNEFPQWRKEQMKDGILKLDWGQIKDYLQ